ncbi:tripartite tricarboxylate transporter permease [Xanthobacteraceae bacterium Astr-EGSB]|uniref:tripartite tricarboxylate transporter permease n=1 Tax=Astrobacterium formosum TaxID=3069710 RepID=UPI0027B0D448|nr:tripartite tricarboxylate transporter permease [Xanthobacteraceae bacterium Astr-EGSB]
MDILQHLTAGLSLLIQPLPLLMIVVGTIVGIVVGVIPGLTATMAIAIAVPMTFVMDAMPGLALLIAVYVGGMTGGLVSAVLLRIPGTPASIATCFDGYPMAARGEPGRALGYGVFASFLGGGFSYIVLLTMAPMVAMQAVKLTYFDIFSIVMCAMVMIADTSQGSLLKALIAGFVGMLIGIVGPDPISGVARLTFGWSELSGGFAESSVLIGLFAMSQLLVEMHKVNARCPDFNVNYRNIIPKWRDLLESWGNLLRSSLIGTVIGIIPGVGASTASLIAYNQAKLASREPEKFGTGVKDGIIASEAANNAVTGGAMVPLLTLGLPGCPVAALMLSGLIIKDLQPGPALFSNNPGIVYGFFLAFILANFVMFFMMIAFIKPFAMVLKVPKYLLIPPILSLCAFGAYISNNRMMDVWVLVAFGLVAYFAEKNGYSLGSLVLGVILGPIAELQLRRGLSASDSFLPLLTSPISAIFLAIALVILALSLYHDWRRGRPIAPATS